jgi:signal transduction histidine kinase
MTASPLGDILLVDDNPDNLRFLSTVLSGRGYEVRSVTTGSAALMGIQSQPPDLVLLDVVMPGMNGYEVCQRLKSNSETQDIPIIFVSALHEVFDKVQAFSAGAVDYIIKPFQVQEVLARIETQLKIRQLQIQLQNALQREKALNQQIEQMATLDERHRIAREVHDSLGHLLVALNIQLESVQTLWQNNPDEAHKLLLEAKQLGADSLKAVRQSVSDMRMDPLQGKLLEDAIAQLVEEFSHVTGIHANCEIHLSHPLSQSVSATLYRVLQEGLTNICKHAHATAVNIQLHTQPDRIFLTLKDNGDGFQVTEDKDGFGLQGMKERLEKSGGSLTVESQPGMGCQLTAVCPYF